MGIDTKRVSGSDHKGGPPHNLEAERCVLGCCLLDKAALLTVITQLKSDDFHIPRHRKIFEIIQKLFTNNVSPDYISLTNALMVSDTLQDAGGAEYIAGLTNVVPTVRNAEHYADIIEELAQLRRVADLGRHMMSEVTEGKANLREILDKSSNKFLEISQARRRSTYAPISETSAELWAEYSDSYDDKEPKGIKTGYPDLDKFLMGLQPGNLVILAARPSEGKTALALDFARNVAVESNKTVAFMSLEMTKEELAIRLICSTGMIDSGRLKRKDLSDKYDESGRNDWDKINDALKILGSTKIFIDDSPSLTITELRAKVKTIKLEHGLDMVIVDYLQLIDGEVRSSDMRVQEVTRISRGLKSLARELELPVIALSQLSRNLEHREGKKRVPRLSDLRESGSIEQDADVVLFIHRDLGDDEEQEINRYEGNPVQDTQLIIAKNRNGRTGIVQLEFFKTNFTFKQSTEPPVTWQRHP